jgi:uncharacterized delta-60 repeat protein
LFYKPVTHAVAREGKLCACRLELGSRTMHENGGVMQPTSIRYRLLALAFILFIAGYASAQAGSLDPTFASGGIFISPTVQGTANAVAIQSDGKIVVAGGDIAAGNFAATLIRLNTNGTLDTTFGTNGVATLFTTGAFFAMAIQANGEIVVAGSAGPGTSNSYVELARFQTNGTLDTTFGTSGITTTTAIPFTSYSNATGALALQANGEIVLAASSPGVLARFTTSGQLDTTFGTGGLVGLVNTGSSLTQTRISPTQIIVLSNGRILVSAASIGPSPSPTPSTLALYNSNGSLDTTFGAAGTLATPVSASSMLLQSDSKIVVAGSLISQVNIPPVASHVGFGIVRINSNGTLDKTFGAGGVASVDFGTATPLSGAFAVAIQSTGDIVAGGAAAQGIEGLGLNSAFGLTRVTSAGALDTTFGTNGIVITTIPNVQGVFSNVSSLAIQTNGDIVATGSTAAFGDVNNGTAEVARYLGQ